MDKPLKFRCPRCGHRQIEEVLENAIVTQIVEIDAEGKYIDVFRTQILDCNVSHYECAYCGLELAASIDELAEHLLEQEENQNDN